MLETLPCTDSVFSQMIEQYGDMVTRICLVRIGNYHDSKDLWQNVFLKLYQSGIYNEVSPEEVKFWLIRVTVNECKNYQRTLFRKKVVSIEEASPLTEEPLVRELLDVLRELPPHYREVIYLYYYENYSVREISKLLRRRENTVKSQLSRGRAVLKDILEGELLS